MASFLESLKHDIGGLVGRGDVGTKDKAPATTAAAAPASSPQHKAGVTYDPEALINTYFPGLTPQQMSAVRQQLAPYEAQGGPEYHKALLTLAQNTPGLQAKSALTAAFGDGTSGSTVDPLAQQLFFSKTVAPYLDQIRQQTAATTNPLYEQAQAQLPAQFKGTLGSLMKNAQAGEGTLQSALAAAAASAPALDALMQNVTADRNAQQRSYYESLAAKTTGGAGGGDLSSLLQSLGINSGAPTTST